MRNRGLVLPGLDAVHLRSKALQALRADLVEGLDDEMTDGYLLLSKTMYLSRVYLKDESYIIPKYYLLFNKEV